MDQVMTQELIQFIREDKLMKFYKSREWRTLRLEALRRDNNECQMCKDQGKYHKAECVHHIKEVKDYPMLALTLDNLMCLCNKCHNKVHDRLSIREKKKIFINEERW
jgi:5-methylcytosine-specific restriction enzyme A